MWRISLVVLVLAFCALAAAKPCEGGENDPNSQAARIKLRILLDEVHSKKEVIKILRYASQSVGGGGIKYCFTYETKRGKICKGSYVIRFQESYDPQNVKNKCI